MKKYKIIGLGLWLSGAWFGLVSPPLASAVVDIQTLEPAANTTYAITEDAFMQVAPRDTNWGGTRLFLSGQYNIIDNPLVEYDPTHTYRTAILVGSINTLDLTGGIFVRKDIEISLNLPLNFSHVTGQNNEFGLGDMRLQGKIQIPTSYQKIAFAVIPEIFLPTGNQSLFLSNGSVGLGIRGAFEADLGAVRGAINFGFRHTDSAEFLDIDYENIFPWSVGVMWPFIPDWAFNVEATGAITTPINRFNNPSELYVGARYQIHKDLDLHGGFSIGSLGAGGAGDVRGVLGLRYSPNLGGGQASTTSASNADAPTLGLN